MGLFSFFFNKNRSKQETTTHIKILKEGNNNHVDYLYKTGFPNYVELVTIGQNSYDELLNNPEIDNNIKKFAKEFWIPLNICLVKYNLNIEYWQNPLLVKARGGLASGISDPLKRISPSLIKLRAMGESIENYNLNFEKYGNIISRFFFFAFPDVAIWMFTKGSSEFEDILIKTGVKAKIVNNKNYKIENNILDKTIKLYIISTGNKLECSVFLPK